MLLGPSGWKEKTIENSTTGYHSDVVVGGEASATKPMKIVSLNIGRARTVALSSGSISTGIHKAPVKTALELGVLGFAGDERVEVRKMGETHHAVYVFPHEHYAYWQSELGNGVDLPLGKFGENITTTGLLETTTRIGDILRCGGALLQIAHPRIPCRKLNHHMGFKFSRQFLASRRVGFYLRVLETGIVQQDDTITLVDSDDRSPTVDEFIRISQYDYWDTEGLEYLLRSRALVPQWREDITDKLERANNADGWFGLRAMRVFRAESEDHTTVSFYLRCAQEKPLTPFVGGQYITLALTGADGRTSRRAYAISNSDADHSYYRITVRKLLSTQENVPDGMVSSYLCDHISPGDILRMAPPRGHCTIGAAPSAPGFLFLSQGVGLAPTLSRLHHWSQHYAHLPAIHHHVDDPGGLKFLRKELSELGRAQARLSLHYGKDINLQETAKISLSFAVFLAGPSAFVKTMRRDLLSHGVPPGLILQERFG